MVEQERISLLPLSHFLCPASSSVQPQYRAPTVEWDMWRLHNRLHNRLVCVHFAISTALASLSSSWCETVSIYLVSGSEYGPSPKLVPRSYVPRVDCYPLGVLQDSLGCPVRIGRVDLVRFQKQGRLREACHHCHLSQISASISVNH